MQENVLVLQKYKRIVWFSFFFLNIFLAVLNLHKFLYFKLYQGREIDGQYKGYFILQRNLNYTYVTYVYL